MSGLTIYNDLYFTTASIYKKKHLFKTLENIEILYSTFSFLTKEKRVVLYAFCIMSNHIHIVWEILDPHTLEKVQHSLLSYTSKQLLINMDEEMKANFLVNRSDRKHQIWKRNALSIEIRSNPILVQKMNYIHNNPSRAGLVKKSENYFHSSFGSYLSGKSQFDFLTLW